MITREMIKNGFRKNLISLENEYNGCVSLCCKIGENAFYFAERNDCYLTVEQYKSKYTANEIVDFIYTVLKDVESAEEHGLDSVELEYYETILTK
ncbi:MAG: hypothetical protein ACLTVG_01940 [Coprococcus sp.]